VAIAARMVRVGFALHPVKTKIVYCKDNNRRGSAEHESFTFLGFTFRARSARSAWNKHGVILVSFLPAPSREVLKAMGQRVRRWRIHLHIISDLADLARWIPSCEAG
jgi:RNA-directed DNA polymerase